MTVAEILEWKDGTKIESIRVMIADKKVLPKSSGAGNYLLLDIQDLTGKLNFPVWDDVELLDEVLVPGIIADIADATMGTWNGARQLKNPKIHILTEEELKEVDMGLFVPAYDIPKHLITSMEMTIADMKDPWKTIAMHVTGALGCDENKWKAFLECPAAEKHHSNKRGGLFLHTMGVLVNCQDDIRHYVTDPLFYDAKDLIVPDRLRLKAIIHDYKKVDEYEYQTSIRRKPGRPLGHIFDGVAYIREVNKECGGILTQEQEEDLIWAILTHHGQWGPAEPSNPEEWILHLADMRDSRIVGCVEK
jgi:23S rRNA maturation-related 3'-5' exoribonuclease YhaM